MPFSDLNLNTVGAAREIAKLRHILQLHKRAVGVGGAAQDGLTATTDASAAITQKTALMVGKLLHKLLVGPTGPLAMSFLRSNPDTCVLILDLLLQPILPSVSKAIGARLIEMVEAEPGGPVGGSYTLVSFFPPTFAKVNPHVAPAGVQRRSSFGIIRSSWTASSTQLPANPTPTHPHTSGTPCSSLVTPTS